MKVFWKDAEKTILIREASETLTGEEYDSSIQISYQMIREVKHDVYIIFDGTRIQTVPSDSLSHFSSAARSLPLNIALRFLVTKNKVLLSLTGVLQKVMPDNFDNVYYMTTMDEAYEKIAEDKRKRQGTID
jgi:hypothetical protein